jgi:2-dehydro-3-deoxyphosphogluconate aldolase/(4S)-4-hydroxy-2-oxoglutarate aldolase
MRAWPVLPVMVIPETRHALPLAHALAEAGVEVFEITLRTAAALDSLSMIASEYPELAIGAGTVLDARDLGRVQEAGADFAISPGLTDELAESAHKLGITLVPGVMTPSDVMRALGHGLDAVKLFPAAVAGGVPMLKALSGPFPGLGFCPTGGIGPDNFLDFLALGNVHCVGGSWVCPQTLVQEERWEDISALARGAIELARARNQGDPAPLDGD